MDMCLPKFDIYQDTITLNRFKSHAYSQYPSLLSKIK